MIRSIISSPKTLSIVRVDLPEAGSSGKYDGIGGGSGKQMEPLKENRMEREEKSSDIQVKAELKPVICPETAIPDGDLTKELDESDLAGKEDGVSETMLERNTLEETTQFLGSEILRQSLPFISKGLCDILSLKTKLPDTSPSVKADPVKSGDESESAVGGTLPTSPGEAKLVEKSDANGEVNKLKNYEEARILREVIRSLLTETSKQAKVAAAELNGKLGGKSYEKQVSPQKASSKLLLADDPQMHDVMNSNGSLEPPSLSALAENATSEFCNGSGEKTEAFERCVNGNSHPLKYFRDSRINLKETISDFLSREEESFLYKSEQGSRRLHISAPRFTAKGTEPSLLVEDDKFQICFEVSSFSKEKISCRVLNDKIDVYAKQERQNDYGNELHELHQIFKVPKNVHKDRFTAYIKENVLFLEAPFQFD